MNIGSVDVFENETEIVKVVGKLQREGLRHLSVPDDLWHTKKHERAMKSARKMGKKVLANF